MNIVARTEKMIAWACWKTGVTGALLFINRVTGRTPVVMYHSITPKPETGKKVPMVWQTGMALAPSTFDEQIKYFSNNYECVSLQEYIRLREKIAKDKRNLLVITFDDGYVDNYTTATPILKRYNAKATFFLVGCHLENERPAPIFLLNILYDHSNSEDPGVIGYEKRKQILWSGLDALEESENLSSQELSKLDWQRFFISRSQATHLEEDGFEIGSHGYYHLIPSALDRKDFREDIDKSKRVLCEFFHEPQPGFAFPFGMASVVYDQHLQEVSDCGFLYGVTTIEGLNTGKTNAFKLRRIAMDEVPLYVTLFRLTGLRSVFKRLFQQIKHKL